MQATGAGRKTGRLRELVKTTKQEATEEWNAQRQCEGCRARKNGSGGHGKVGLVEEAWKKSSGCRATEKEKGSRHVQVAGVPTLTWIMQLQ